MNKESRVWSLDDLYIKFPDMVFFLKIKPSELKKLIRLKLFPETYCGSDENSIFMKESFIESFSAYEDFTKGKIISIHYVRVKRLIEEEFIFYASSKEKKYRYFAKFGIDYFFSYEYQSGNAYQDDI